MHNYPADQYSSGDEERPLGIDPVGDIPKFFQQDCGIQKYLSQ